MRDRTYCSSTFGDVRTSLFIPEPPFSFEFGFPNLAASSERFPRGIFSPMSLPHRYAFDHRDCCFSRSRNAPESRDPQTNQPTSSP